MSLPEAEEIFHRALEQPGAEARTGYLNSACAGKPALRAQVEQLLVAHEAPTGFLDTVSDNPIKVTGPVEEALGARIGRYKLLEKVGEGGCGVVYVAEQTEPVRRRVALKVIKLGMDTKAVVARFEAERQALAMMDHPNIAKILDAGTTDPGRPYFVMELVRGIRITDYCDQNNLSTKNRLDLLIKICHAIQHAHQKGIIHREIKPSNILVTLHDGVPVPKVIDFGIAKATEGRLTDATVYTQLHQFIGTPAYMSPEQAEMSGLDIDTRSDIYSLGVLLYELLTGRTPFDANELMSQGLDAMRKTIREKEPVRPSMRLTQELVGVDVRRLKLSDPPTTETQVNSRVSSRRLLQIKEALPLIKGDLDWIVMKCLEKDRTRRYETANGLAADLKRHLNNEPVVARPPSAAYKFQKAFRRNKLAFGAATAIVAALVLGVIGTTVGLIRADNQRRIAEESQKLAEQRFRNARQFIDAVFQKVAPELSDLIGASKAREALARTSVGFFESLGVENTTDETFRVRLGELYAKLADALGNRLDPNSVGDYVTALRFANQSLAIAEDLYMKSPTDPRGLRALEAAEARVGNLLYVLRQHKEALIHFRRSAELSGQLLSANPNDLTARYSLEYAHYFIGHVLSRQGHTKEALEQHYLPYAKDWLASLVDERKDSNQAHRSWVANTVVGDALLALDRNAEALHYYQQALAWTKLLVDREPNNARWARDWSTTHCELGNAFIALGRLDEGMTNLQQAVCLAENLVMRDPSNSAFQLTLLLSIHAEAKGWARSATTSGFTRSQQAELWQRAIRAFSRCEERLASPETELSKPGLTNTAKQVAEGLNEARTALAKLAADVGVNSTSPAKNEMDVFSAGSEEASLR